MHSIVLFRKLPLIGNLHLSSQPLPSSRPHIDSWRVLSSFLLPQSDIPYKGAPLCPGLNGLGTGKVMLQRASWYHGRRPTVLRPESVVPTEVAVLTEATTTCHGKLNFWIHRDYSWEGGARKPSV